MFVAILFVVFMVFWGLSCFPSGPVANYPWAPWGLAFLCVALLGWAVFGGIAYR